MGMLATADIGQNEPFVKVPSKLILTTKVCLQSELAHIFHEHPDLFGMHNSDGEDNLLNTYIMFELGKGEKSFWKPMFDVWPRDTDILMSWNEDDLEWLQDPTLATDAEKQYSDFHFAWNALYKVLSQYPAYFSEESIGLYRYRWVSTLTTNRCFGSSWPHVCAMIPYAEFINHENVNVQYDYIDKEGKSIEYKEEKKKEDKEEKLMRMLRQKLFLEDLKSDLQKMESEIRAQIQSVSQDQTTDEASTQI